MVQPIPCDLLNLLPAEERNDLRELLNELVSEDPERTESAALAINEMLNREPVQVRRMELSDADDLEEMSGWLDWISTKVREARKAAGMTQHQLGEAAGIPQSHVSRIERGKLSPTHMTIEKIARALGIEPQELDPSA